jgi:hypothetical protein
MKYIAQVRKGGRLYFQTGPHDSRELAALAAFTNGPTWTMTCCTLLASQGDDGNWQLNGFYIRWHRRDDFPTLGQCSDTDELPTDHRNPVRENSRRRAMVTDDHSPAQKGWATRRARQAREQTLAMAHGLG